MPHLIDLGVLLARERERIEWKDDVADVDDVVATLSAFANDLPNLGGGYVICGAREVRDDSGFPSVERLGLDSARLREVEGKVLTRCRDSVHPSIAPLVEELQTSDPARRILVFIMPASRAAHTFRRDSDSGKHYVRVGRSTREARNGTLRELLVQKGAVEPWDHRPNIGATSADLDLLALRDFLTRVGLYEEGRPIESYLTRPLSPFAPELCTREPLTGALRPRNVAVLLFGKEPQRFLRGAVSLFSSYSGVEKDESPSARHELGGTLLSQLDQLFALLEIEAAAIIDKRHDASALTMQSAPGEAASVARYSRRALREAAVNALAHRDYELVDPVRVVAFSDRIEFYSPGGLPLGVTIDDIRAGQPEPRWRNNALAWFLTRLGLAEAEGQGVRTILRDGHRLGTTPTFDANAARVRCVLPAARGRLSRMG